MCEADEQGAGLKLVRLPGLPAGFRYRIGKLAGEAVNLMVVEKNLRIDRLAFWIKDILGECMIWLWRKADDQGVLDGYEAG